MIDVTCAIILKDNKILVTQRSEKMSVPLKWEFPGGKVKVGETEADCLKREIKEELNLEIEIVAKVQNHSYSYNTFSINLIPFIAKYNSGELILAEHANFKWLEKSELRLLDWAAADIAIVEDFIKSDYETRPI